MLEDTELIEDSNGVDDMVFVQESQDVFDMYQENPQNELSKISEKTIDYSNHGENEQPNLRVKRSLKEF